MNFPKVKVICWALVVNNGSILLVQEAKQHVKWKRNLPMGHAEVNESLFSCAIREVKEETNIDINLEGLLGIYQYKSDRGNNIILHIFVWTPINYDIKFPQHEILNVKRFSFEELSSLSIEEFRINNFKTMISDYKERWILDLNIIRSLV